MKKIVYATDFSRYAEQAFHFALNIAERHKAELIMVHVFNTPAVRVNNFLIDPTDIILERVLKYEEQLKDLFNQFDSKVKPKFIAVESDSVIEGILTLIERHKPNLIVTGVKGKNIVKEIFMGSTTKALLKRSPIPLLAIPENAEYKDFNKVIYTSDFQNFDLNSIEQLLEFVKPYKPEIEVVHICTDDENEDCEKMEAFKNRVKENISYKNISFEILMSENLFATLNTYTKENGFDLLVMLEKERFSIVEKLFHEDLVWKMEFNTSIPLLSYNEHFLKELKVKEINTGDTVEHR